MKGYLILHSKEDFLATSLQAKGEASLVAYIDGDNIHIWKNKIGGDTDITLPIAQFMNWMATRLLTRQ